MYLKQKCPSCGTEKEFVYVQVGHAVNCKHCNYEFVLAPKRMPLLPYLVWGGILLTAAGIGFYLVRQFHDWWIYR
ncbi:MAG: hypothetical protein QM703_20315 [Gemmatales bacterium]